MREILFRGKRKDNGEWIEGSLLKVTIRNKIYHLVFEDSFSYDGKNVKALLHGWVDPKTVGQYTGLCDKHGKKIFEGDVCKHRSNYSGDFIISVVTFTDGQFLAMADNSGFNLSDKLEVIGNIHDNPELLEANNG